MNLESQNSLILFLKDNFNEHSALEYQWAQEKLNIQHTLQSVLGQYTALKDSHSIQYRRIRMLENALRVNRKELSIDQAQENISKSTSITESDTNPLPNSDIDKFINSISPVLREATSVDDEPSFDLDSVLENVTSSIDNSTFVLREYLSKLGISEENPPSETFDGHEDMADRLISLAKEIRTGPIDIGPPPTLPTIKAFPTFPNPDGSSDTSMINSSGNDDFFDFDGFGGDDTTNSTPSSSAPDDAKPAVEVPDDIKDDIAASGFNISEEAMSKMMKKMNFGKKKKKSKRK